MSLLLLLKPVLHVANRLMNIPTGSFVEIYNFHLVILPEHMADDVRYVRITNMDDTNQIVMKLNHKDSDKRFTDQSAERAQNYSTRSK